MVFINIYILFLAQENEMKIYLTIAQNRQLFRKKDGSIKDIIINDTPISKLSEEEQFLGSSKYLKSCLFNSSKLNTNVYDLLSF